MNHFAVPTPRVLKLGGSLLLLPDWPERLTAWLEIHPAPLNLLLVGGGEIVNAVRELDAQHGFPITFVHWLCIDLLSATACIAGQLLPAFPLLTTQAELQQVLRDGRLAESLGKQVSPLPTPQHSLNYIVDVSCFYRAPAALSEVGSRVRQNSASRPNSGVSGSDSYSAHCPLPENWDTTSDSLAAWLASLVGAAELVLFKSTTPTSEHQTPRAWVEQAIVDAAFNDVLPPTVSVTIVNLLEP